MEMIGCLVPELRNKKASQTQNITFEEIQCFYIAMVNFIIVLRKIDTCHCKNSLKVVGKDSGCESRDLHYVYRQKDNRIWTGSLCIMFFEECVPGAYSNTFLYFADLPVSSSLYRRYSSRARLHNSARYSPSSL